MRYKAQSPRCYGSVRGGGGRRRSCSSGLKRVEGNPHGENNIQSEIIQRKSGALSQSLKAVGKEVVVFEKPKNRKIATDTELQKKPATAFLVAFLNLDRTNEVDYRAQQPQT